ncbi:hypothetical protein ALC57_02264 [Trachymyrmex cornetzi]|uniref:Uncharacterized protein n=1 Tax=Trachymyrmex cornetzi TaxID=471704 RepID=A0A195EK13_9HYME|nr:hypothetical protein ALC57_02264 [Trachymyrmex cornetzi]
MARGRSRMSLSDDERKRIKEIQESVAKLKRLVIRGFTGRKLRFKLSPFLFLVYRKPEVVAPPPPPPPSSHPPSPSLHHHRQRASFYSPSSPTPFQLYSRLAEVSL